MILPDSWQAQHIWDVAHVVGEIAGTAWAVGRVVVRQLKDSVREAAIAAAQPIKDDVQKLARDFREHAEDDRREFREIREWRKKFVVRPQAGT